MSYKTKIIIFVLAAVLLLPLAVTVFLNQSDIRNLISTYVESKTGRVLIIEGDLGVKWSLIPKIYAQQIRFANSRWARTPFAFSADKLTVSLSVVALLRGELKITAIELDKPQLWIEWLPETKKFNLDLRTSQKGTKRSRLLPDWVAIRKLTIRHGEIVYFRKNRDWEFIIDNATVESKGANRPVHIKVAGEIEKTAVSMAGELGSLESLLRFQESPVTLSGYVGAPSNSVSISGVIQNVFRWYGLNLWVNAQITNLADLSDLLGFWLPSYRNISATWEFIQPETARTIRVESLKLASSEYGLQAYAEGEIGQLIGFNEVDIRFNAKGNLDPEIISSNLIQEASLDTSIVGSVFGNRKDLTLHIEQAQMLADGISVNTAGTVSNVLYDWSAPLSLNMEIENLNALLRVFDMSEGMPGLKWPDTQEINVQANFNHQKSSFALQDIKISSASESLNLDAGGEIHDLGADYSGEIEFTTRINRQRLGQVSASRFLALLDELSVAGTVLLKDSVAKLSQVEIQGTGDGINLSGIGSVGNVETFQDFQMDMQLAVKKLSKLESLAKQKLPLAGPLEMVGVLNKDAEGKFNLNEIVATLTDPDLTLAMEGEIRALGETPNISLNIDMRLDAISPIERVYPKFPLSGLLSQLLPLQGNAQLSSQVVDNQVFDSRAGGYSLRKIKVTTRADKFSGQVHGRIDNLFANLFVGGSPQSSELPAQESSDQALSGKLSLDLSRVVGDGSVVDVPALKPFVLSGNLSAGMDIIFSGDDVGLENIDFNMNSEQATLTARGAFRRLSPLQPDKFEVQFDAKSLASIIGDTRLPLVWDNPTKGTISFSNNEGNNAHKIMLDVEIAESNLSGEISFLDSRVGDDMKRSYRANLDSKNFDLISLFVEADKSDRFFSRTPIKLDWLINTQAEIKFSADHFKSPSFALDDFKSATSVDNGVLHTNMSGASSRGAMEANLVLTEGSQHGQSGAKEQAQKWHARLDVKGKNVDFSALTQLRKSASDNAGIFSVAIDLDGVGNSISEIVGNARGALLLEFSEAKVKNDGLQFIGGDLLLGVITAIDPLRKQDKYMDIECGVIQFDVNEGVATHRSVLKTTAVTMLGDGAVNLDDETLKIRIRTKARKGLGINVNTIAKIIRVGGTIKQPQIEIDPKGLLQSGFALGAAIASGGISLLVQGLYDKTQANADVCRVATVSGETN